jgi:demethylmenaquinone methyltransferase/2-methoxy-6-polyprenyl-1,4-benzoquinol methylase
VAAFWLKPWPKDSGKRASYVDAVFRRVAPRYDLLTQLLSWGQDERWKERVVSLLPPPPDVRRVLDLATGTGAFPAMLHRHGYDAPVVALDRSSEMLTLARRKVAAPGRVSLVRADLNALPLRDGAFDVALMGYGLRYLDDLSAGLRAIGGCLRPGGVLVALDFGLPERSWYRRLCLGYLFLAGTILGWALHGRGDTYWHIVESLRAYPGQSAVADALARAGFDPVVLIEDLGGISVTVHAARGGAARNQARGRSA